MITKETFDDMASNPSDVLAPLFATCLCYGLLSDLPFSVTPGHHLQDPIKLHSILHNRTISFH
jgi:hypothetical protein